jgi:hypothetical protein
MRNQRGIPWVESLQHFTVSQGISKIDIDKLGGGSMRLVDKAVSKLTFLLITLAGWFLTKRQLDQTLLLMLFEAGCVGL